VNGAGCYHAQNAIGQAMKYCSVCGNEVRVGVPQGDNRPRHICDQCGTVHYHNPKVVAGCIAHWEDKVLMCRRAIEPRHGLWTVPAGFMENGETTYEGAMRETLEEANARVAVDDLYVTVNLPHINQVYMLFRGRLLDLDYSPGEESLDVRLMGEEEIPWEQMAFPTVSEALRLYFADRANGSFPVRMLDIVREGGVPGRYVVRRIS
jgi:ADP-ribose pyrophosphatase YjhB (NUDIX family)